MPSEIPQSDRAPLGRQPYCSRRHHAAYPLARSARHMVKLDQGEHQVRGAPRRQVRDQNCRWPEPMDLDSSHTAQTTGRLDWRRQARRNSRGREGDRSMVGEAPAHNEATGRDLYASLIGWPPAGRRWARAAKRKRERGGWSRWGARSIRPHPVSFLLARGTGIARKFSTSFVEVPVNSSRRAPRAWRKPASIQTCDGHPGRWRHSRSRDTNW
jgi:hypothetical protein